MIQNNDLTQMEEWEYCDNQKMLNNFNYFSFMIQLK